MFRMQEKATGLKAYGIVGVTVSQRSHIRGSRITEFLAIGTAIRLGEPERSSAVE